MKNNKRKFFILFLFILGLFLTFNHLSSQQTAGELFEKALYMEEAQGELQKAIDLYKEILEQFPNDREIAAKAQLHIGLCYEKLGLTEAPKAYQKVLDDFPEQKEAVKVAKEKLSVLLRAQTFIEKEDKEFNIRKVWAGPVTDTLGAPSPDGKYLSFVDWNTGDLAIRELSSGKNRHLTDKGSWLQSQEFALFSRWSPDGKRIVYNWYNKEELFDLRIIGLDSPKPQILYSVKKMEYVHPFAWSPDGKHILIAITEENGGKVGLISVEDGSFRVLKTLDRRIYKFALSGFVYSPDGKYIAFSFPPDKDTQKGDIFLLSIDGKHEIPLINHPAHDILLGWAADGKWILFASDRTGTLDAWAIQVADGVSQRSPVMIKKDLGQIEPLGFTRNGSFYYGISNIMTDIYTVSLDPDTGKILSQPAKATQRYEGSNACPDFSSDGKYLAYISGRGPEPIRRNVLCIRDVQTGKEREIRPELTRFSYPRWSPDSQFVSVEGTDKTGRMGIYKIDVQTGAVESIVQVDSEIVIYSHRWSKDGKAIFYARSDPDTKGPRDFKSSRIFIHDVTSGQEKVLPGSPSDAKDIDVSPDGRWLVLLNRDKKRVLRIMPTSGGEPRAIHSFEQQGNFIIGPAWIARGRYILFSQEKPDSDEAVMDWELVRILAEGGEPQRLGLVMTQFRHFSVHPDGQQIAFHSRGSKIRWPEIWIMENFLPKEK